MISYRMFDASTPPQTAPPGCHAVMGYLGGNTPHIWTPAEWRRFEHLPQVPVYVPDFTATASTQAAYAVNLMLMLGWARDQPASRILVFDFETAVNPEFYDSLAQTTLANGFTPVCYGSMSTVLRNAAVDVLAADWGVLPVIPHEQTMHGIQDQANVPYEGTSVDYSVIDGWFLARGGVGPRHG